MHGKIRWFVAGTVMVLAVIVGALLLAGGGTAGDAISDTPPATIEKIDDGGAHSRLTLAARAAERLGIVTTAIRAADPAVVKRLPAATVVPYSALLYDAAGKTYVYTNPESTVYVREQVTVDSIDRDAVILSASPRSGTAVVSVGAIELYGLEFGIGK
ncbi:hypothetical protein EV644_11179 [Kribbella orskensis]|uniref:Uncharacterized protein n=1 Tax=Kribbella orskensis TaxID=2512216 RepID=A0ABY2BG94_9ACTN|nr:MULTISPECIES: hypothetical protein [Kribbella]TCN37657.1 hypothetical protein EV642_111186 [Kribbella sp. VKM Ac-2500]TCO18841.1 hypothetical protein EV644_11179 [Kribbella orskensis]